MDLALNNQQRLICHKIQPTNQPTYKLFVLRIDTFSYKSISKNYY